MSDLEFKYVVQRKQQERICFLSGCERKLNVFAESQTPSKYYCYPGTSALYKTLNKIRSNRGVGGLASLAPRFEKMRLEQIPPPTQYDLRREYIHKPAVNMFGSGPKLGRTYSTTPGPGTYGISRKCRRTQMLYTLGGRTYMKPAIEIYCITKPTDTCDLCQRLCTGDYWQLEHLKFLCLKCMRREWRGNSLYQPWELKQFKKMRNCSFMHQHEGTTAALQLLPKKTIFEKARKENYLNLYLNKY